MPPFTAGLIVSASLVASALATAGGWNGTRRSCRARPPAAAGQGQAATAGGERLTADTPKTTTAGNGFIAPAGWSVAVRGPATILEAPEGGSRLALIDVQGADAEAAVAAAWAAYPPQTRWPLKVTNDLPDKDGWSRRRQMSYQTSPNERRDVAAFAQHANGQWTVVIYDMAQDVGEKRGAQVGLVFDRLLPKGYTRETFAGKTAHPLDAARIAALGAFVEAARKATGVPGVSVGLVQDGKTVFAGGFGVRELGTSDAGRRRQPLHDCLEHQGADDAAARQARRSTQDHLGHAGDDVAAVVQARRRGDHAPGARQAPDLRLHRPASPGLRVAVRVQGPHTGARGGRARLDAADQQVRRDVPVLEPARRRRRLRRRARAVSRSRARDGVRPRDAGAGPDSARHDLDDVRLCARARRQPCRRARAGRRRPSGGRGDGDQLLHHPGAARRGRVEQCHRHAQVRADGAGAGRRCPAAPATSARRRCSSAARRRCPPARTPPTAWGCRSTPRTACRSSITAAT